jgi:hypothetical protein
VPRAHRRIPEIQIERGPNRSLRTPQRMRQTTETVAFRIVKAELRRTPWSEERTPELWKAIHPAFWKNP